MDNIEAVAERLTQLDQTFGGALPEMVGVAPEAWRNFKAGLRLIDPQTALKVSKATGASLDWIYAGKEETLPAGLAQKIKG